MIARPAKGKKEKKNQDIGGTKMTINKTKKKLIEENKQCAIKLARLEERLIANVSTKVRKIGMVKNIIK